MAQQITACCKELVKIICCITNNFQNMKIAIEKGNIEEFKMYFEKKKVKIQDYEEDTGNNPLHLTVKANRHDMAEYVLNRMYGLEREDKNFDGDTALMLAVLYSDLKMFNSDISNIQLSSTFKLSKYNSMANNFNDLQVKVKLLIDKGVDVNAKESEGFTPFMAACANGKIDIVEYLMKDKSCQTAIHRAAFYGEVQVIRLLQANPKLSLSSRDSRGNTCLHFAAMRLNMTCFRYILKKLGEVQGKAEMQKKNQEGLTPVQMLIKSFNMIKKDDRVITEAEVINYINDKNKPPQNLYESLKEQKPNIFTKIDPQKEQLIQRPGSQPVVSKQMVSENQDHQVPSKKNLQVVDSLQEQEMQNLNSLASQKQEQQNNQVNETIQKETLEQEQTDQPVYRGLKSPIGENPIIIGSAIVSPNFAKNEENLLNDQETPNPDQEIKNLSHKRKNNYANLNLQSIARQVKKNV